jgi:hypothetical protein
VGSGEWGVGKRIREMGRVGEMGEMGRVEGEKRGGRE